MKRSNTVIIILSALSLGVFCAWKSTEDAKRRGPLVYALKDLKAGTEITSDAVEIRLVDESKMSGSDVEDPSLIIGRKVLYGIQIGQVFSIYDFVPPEKTRLYMHAGDLPLLHKQPTRMLQDNGSQQ